MFLNSSNFYNLTALCVGGGGYFVWKADEWDILKKYK